MKKILYIGNKLNNPRSNISYINRLGSLLTAEGINISYASSYTNKIMRLCDMIYNVVKHRSNVNGVLIDTYSTQNFYYAFIISQLCRFFKLEYFPILHGGNLPSRLKDSPNLSRQLFSNAKVNIAPSKFIQHAFTEHGYSNVIHIPNTLKLDNYRFKKREFQTIRLLWVRSFSKIYNPLLAVEVLDHLINKGFDAELCMVGPDSDGSLLEVKKLAKKRNLKVKFTGKLTKEEWCKLSESYNIFINTANFDNMPLSVIEAMALGLIIVSTNVGGIPYLIEDNKDGLLVPPKNAEAMVNAIIKIKTDEELSNVLVLNARKKVESFDWEVIKSKWIALLS